MLNFFYYKIGIVSWKTLYSQRVIESHLNKLTIVLPTSIYSYMPWVSMLLKFLFLCKNNPYNLFVIWKQTQNFFFFFFFNTFYPPCFFFIYISFSFFKKSIFFSSKKITNFCLNPTSNLKKKTTFIYTTKIGSFFLLLLFCLILIATICWICWSIVKVEWLG